MIFLVRVFVVSVALFLLASCSKGREKTAAPESNPKSAVTSTVSAAPKAKAVKASRMDSSAGKGSTEYNGITQFGHR